MRDGFSVRMDIQDDYVVFDGDSRWDLCFHFQLILADLVLNSTTFVRLGSGAPGEFLIGVNDGTLSFWIFDILDSDRDPSSDDLFHSEWMNDFGTVICQFGGFIRGDNGYKSSCWNFAWVGCEDSIDFLPDL